MQKALNRRQQREQRGNITGSRNGAIFATKERRDPPSPATARQVRLRQTSARQGRRDFNREPCELRERTFEQEAAAPFCTDFAIESRRAFIPGLLRYGATRKS